MLKFIFSKKATKVEKIFTVFLTLCSKCQIDGEDFVNFCGLLRKHELYTWMIIQLSIFWVSLCAAVMSSSLFNRQKRQKVSRKFPLQVMSSIFWCDIFTVPLVGSSTAQNTLLVSRSEYPRDQSFILTPVLIKTWWKCMPLKLFSNPTSPFRLTC
jgi:hypothetical protein